MGQNWTLISIVSVISLVLLVGIIGNALVIYIIVANSDMRSVTNFYIANLAVDDIAFLLTCCAFTAATIGKEWMLGGFICKLVGYMQFVTIQATCFFLTAMTIDRYHLIVHAVNARNTRTIRRAILISLGIWAVSILIHIPAAIYTNSYVDKYNYTVCNRDFGSPKRDNIHTMFAFLSMYVIPLLIITICYVNILMQVWKRTSMGTESAQAQLKASQRKRKITRMVFIVVILFALSWLPLHAIILGMEFYDGKPVFKSSSFQYLNVFCLCLAYANSSMNPFVYAFTTNSFKKHFDRIFRGLCNSSKSREKGNTSVMMTETRFSKLAMSTDGNSLN
ncbi:G-protein coupled receptor 54-like [Anneissia japonica]|uniref:G-protein coupled receptor 54-like n=1 Tax=Anneissia japonica TaxID=1529436 RepID=UPI0014259474|nr:G-protein coupled receptor 54-like [Anneissia japonica]